MNKFVLIMVLFVFNILLADLKNTYFNNNLMLDKDLIMIDIRTKSEIKENGKLEGSVNIPFFNEQGQYDIEYFLDQFYNTIDKKKKVAIICRSGSRSAMVSKFLNNNFKDLHLINILGGTIFIEQFKIAKLIKEKK